MSSAQGASELRVSEDELIRCVKSRSETFTRLSEGEIDEFPSPKEALFAGSTLLTWEQRGYRDRDQIARVLCRLPLVNEVSPEEFNTIVDRAIRTVDEIFDRKTTTPLDELIEKLGALDPNERRRAVREHGFEWPTTDQVQVRLQRALFETMAQRQNRLFVAPTALGKTGLIVGTRWLDRRDITGGEPVVLSVGTTEARNEAKNRAQDNGLEVAVLESYDDLCPVAKGDYDDEVWIEGIPASEWFNDEIETRGHQAGESHSRAEWLYDGTLPCCAGEATCPLREQWEHVPRHDDYDAPCYDLIIATDPLLHVPSLRQGTNVLQDEQPGYTTEFGDSDEHHQQRIQRMVRSFLREIDAPVKTWEQFVSLARSDVDATEVEESIQQDPSEDWPHYGENAHKHAPVLTRVLWKAFSKEADQNGRSTAILEYASNQSDNYNDAEEQTERKWLSVVVNADNEVCSVRNIPDFSVSRSVIGLDAWPCPPLWEQNVLPDIDIERVLDRDERQLWRLFERELTVVQVGQASRPMTNMENFYEEHAQVIIETLYNRYPDQFSTAGAPKSIRNRIGTLMDEVGIEEPVMMHHGEQKSRNDFRDESVGFLYASIDPGDDPILDRLAECGYTARPEYRGYDILCEKCSTRRGDGCDRCLCDHCRGSGCTVCHKTGRKRAHGRKFVGPDADKAEDLLASVRECNNAQMVGRWARKREISGIVFCCTDALPDSLVDYTIDDIAWPYGEKQRAVVEQMKRHDCATVTEIEAAIIEAETGFAEGVSSIARNTVRQTLNRLAEHGKLTIEENATSTGAHVYEVVSDEHIGTYGIADLAVPNSDV
ncbi:hypothetical protein [Natrinema sp. H-ect4]|uniref:hypothetical protein n=1 Tax=Natrinema sp. H-ect4 TaxID=3242699 RepID=UPI0035A942B6